MIIKDLGIFFSENFYMYKLSFFSNLLFIVSAIFLFSCSKKQKYEEVAIPVTAMQVIEQTIPANFQFVGVAESSHIVELRARVEGYLESINYAEGEIVRQNQLMFVLDQRPFIAEVEKAEGEVIRQKAKLWDARQSKNRMVPLYKENAVSQRDYDNAISDEYAAEGNLITAEGNLYKAELNLGFASIKAPVSGMASRAIYREGALIAPGPHSLLTNIFVLDPIWVNFSVSEGDILKARKEKAANQLVFPKDNNFKIEVILSDDSIFPAEGKINFLDPALQQNTGTMLVRSIVPNPNYWLRPGQFVKVVVKGAYRPNAVIVPQTAVQQGQRGIFVYVINKEGRTELRGVELGDWYENYWIITSGLKKGDMIVAEGPNRVQNNSLVRISHLMPPTPEKEQENQENKDELLGALDDF